MKLRILEFIDYLGISKREFYEKTGIKRTVIEKTETSLTEMVLTKFIAVYDQVNLEWLVSGKGSMIKLPEIGINESSDCEMCDKKDKLIEKLEHQLERQENEIKRLIERE